MFERACLQFINEQPAIRVGTQLQLAAFFAQAVGRWISASLDNSEHHDYFASGNTCGSKYGRHDFGCDIVIVVSVR